MIRAWIDAADDLPRLDSASATGKKRRDVAAMIYHLQPMSMCRVKLKVVFFEKSLLLHFPSKGRVAQLAEQLTLKQRQQ